MSNAFAPIVRARPCPIFGRPVHLWVAPRLRPDTSPQTLRIPDRSGHPVLHRLAPLAGKALPLPLDTAPLIRAPEGTLTLLTHALPSAQYDFGLHRLGCLKCRYRSDRCAQGGAISLLNRCMRAESATRHLVAPSSASSYHLSRLGSRPDIRPALAFPRFQPWRETQDLA